MDAALHRVLQVAVADNERARVAPSAEMPGWRGGEGREIAYQAWEEGRSADPGVSLAASPTESGCTERWPRSRRVPLCIISSFPMVAACSLFLSFSLSLSSFLPRYYFYPQWKSSFVVHICHKRNDATYRGQFISRESSPQMKLVSIMRLLSRDSHLEYRRHADQRNLDIYFIPCRIFSAYRPSPTDSALYVCILFVCLSSAKFAVSLLPPRPSHSFESKFPISFARGDLIRDEDLAKIS